MTIKQIRNVVIGFAFVLALVVPRLFKKYDQWVQPEINGTVVVSSKPNTPITNAEIVVSPDNFESYVVRTNELGEFHAFGRKKMLRATAGPYITGLECSAIGYKSVSTNVFVDYADVIGRLPARRLNILFELAPTESRLPSVAYVKFARD